MSTTMTALDSSSIRHAEFIRLTMPSNTYTFCNAASPITVSGITFTNLGSLLQLSDIKRDIKATSSDLSVSLTGVDGTNVAVVLGSDIKGSRIEVWRGFLDSNNQIITTPTQQFFKRYQGIVSNFSITEDFNEQMRIRVATVGLSCASFRTILENRVGGVRTTPKIWQAYYPGDTSMNRVPTIAGSYFDFGGQPNTSGSQASSNAPSQRIFGR
jgi:hypothetical protein